MADTGKNDTPAMRQFHHFKQQHPGCVLFFRMGDFYEMFYDDAKLAHKVLGVALTHRTKGIPMAGVPYHSVAGYLRGMLEAGHRVAVCDQMEDAAQAKGVVRREVTRVITPGTLTDELLLEEGKPNPLAAVLLHGDQRASIAWAELSTGAFTLATVASKHLADELARIDPRELLYPQPTDHPQPSNPIQALSQTLGCTMTARPDWQFGQSEAIEALCKQFRVKTLEGFGLTQDDPALGPAAAVVHYLLETQAPAGNDQPLLHLNPPRRFERQDYLMIDQVSLRSLEVERTLRSDAANLSLLGVLQGCVTAMGKRTLRQWLCYPLGQRKRIEQRQRVVGAMADDPQLLDELRQALDSIQDVQRIVARIAVGRATPRDIVALGRSAAQGRVLVELLADRPATQAFHDRLVGVTQPLETLAQTIAAACIEAPPAHLRDGGLIRDGYDNDLDDCRRLQHNSHTWLANYQKQLIEQSGIANLKVGFNKVFGYYIEVTATNKDKAPPQWARRQTLKNAERYTTPELKEFEGKALTAQQRAVAREQVLFAELCAQAQAHLKPLRAFGEVVAALDVLACFAHRAVRSRYVKPTIVDEPVLNIQGGRHPVLDRVLAERFVPNDLTLGAHPQTAGGEVAVEPGPTLALITGPNMAGKSTYIRQAALITLMAHTGSFVPADAATIGLCDRIFTRIGASDELHAGQSTFMVEMVETANICHHATPASLVILDEIGRGTSTLDGLSLAWAIAEHLAQRRSRTLFATHYHELTDLAQRFENVTNLNVSVREWGDEVVFLHRIVPGATDRSYGIHVAKLAGLPQAVVSRAQQLLGQLSVSHASPSPAQGPQGDRPGSPTLTQNGQLPLFTEFLEHPVVIKLKQMDLDRLTPIGAFDALRGLREHLDEPPR